MKWIRLLSASYTIMLAKSTVAIFFLLLFYCKQICAETSKHGHQGVAKKYGPWGSAMLENVPMLHVSYYAQNYAGIIRQLAYHGFTHGHIELCYSKYHYNSVYVIMWWISVCNHVIRMGLGEKQRRLATINYAKMWESAVKSCASGWKLLQSCGLYHCGVMAAQTQHNHGKFSSSL